MQASRISRFQKAVCRGRRFERRERHGWVGCESGTPEFETPTKFQSRRGRIDIRINETSEYVSIVELKATNWNRISAYAVRSTALRHARQVWRYASAELAKGLDVCAGVIYERTPRCVSVRTTVERALNERFIQVVWRSGPAAQQSLQPEAATIGHRR